MRAVLYKPATYLGGGDSTAEVTEFVEGETADELIAAACKEMRVDEYDYKSGDGCDATLHVIDRDLSEEFQIAWRAHMQNLAAAAAEKKRKEEEDKKACAEADKRRRLEREIAAIENGTALAEKRADLEALRAPAPPTADEATP